MLTLLDKLNKYGPKFARTPLHAVSPGKDGQLMYVASLQSSLLQLIDRHARRLSSAAPAPLRCTSHASTSVLLGTCAKQRLGALFAVLARSWRPLARSGFLRKNEVSAERDPHDTGASPGACHRLAVFQFDETAAPDAAGSVEIVAIVSQAR